MRDCLFANGNGVIFGDVAGNAPQTVNIAGQVNPGLIVVNADATGYTWTGSGSLVGSSKLQKTGSGTLSIATDNAGFSGEVRWAAARWKCGMTPRWVPAASSLMEAL